MRKRLIILATALTLVILAISAWGCGTLPSGGGGAADNKNLGNVSQQNTGIWVTGVGKIKVIPDVAVISLGVETQAATVADAQQQAAKAMSDIMGVLKNNGIADKDITTQNYSVYPVYNYDNGRQTLIGYRVANMVTAKIRKIEDTGKIIDAVVAAGGDYTRINSISFTVDQPEKYNEEARKQAMADAQTKAKQLASLGGVKLGKATYISESGGYTQPPIIYRGDAGLKEGTTPTTPISPGETELQLTVQVIYSIS